MPVLPDVGSTIVVFPGLILPSASAASIIATPIRSLTLPAGLYASSLPISSAPQSGATRVRRAIGVLPTRSARLSGIARAGGDTSTLASLSFSHAAGTRVADLRDQERQLREAMGGRG